MQKSYKELGLSEKDILRMQECNLNDLLDKLLLEQQNHQRQQQQLEKALNKIEKDLSAAREAQMSLLPKGLAGVPGVEFRARFFPSQFVSGDIYNIFRLDERHIGLYHIDISGHGVPAALFSVSLSQILNTNVSSRNLLKIPAKEPPFYRLNPPDKVIALLNEDQSFERYGIFFTMIYMILDIKSGNLHYTRAGHNLPIILHANGKVDMPDSGGLPIGWDFPRQDEVMEIKLEPGDRIFMYSDGITEATNPADEMFSTEKLIEILSRTRSDSLDQSLDHVLADLRGFTGDDSFEDDVSILGLTWR